MSATKEAFYAWANSREEPEKGRHLALLDQFYSVKAELAALEAAHKASVSDSIFDQPGDDSVIIHEVIMSRNQSGGSRKISFNVSDQYDIQDVVGEGAYGVVW